MKLLASLVAFTTRLAYTKDPGTDIFLVDGSIIPADEGGAMNKLTDWLDKLHWSGDWKNADTQRGARAELERLAGIVGRAPWLALGVGQSLLSYFWWVGEGMDIDVGAARLSASMHFASIRVAGCDEASLHAEGFQALHCSWRWRHLLMILTELGVHLARQRTDLALAAGFLREGQTVFGMMKRLPHFRRDEWPTPCSINTNAEFFRGQVNRPIWPSKGHPFAEFLEANVETFRADLKLLLETGQFDHLYWTGEVSFSQFASRHEGWTMLSLYKNQKLVPRVCALANASCAALAARPEIAQCTAGDAGAAFTRLLPGQGLRPHFWNAPRLGAHLGLRTPPGATMWVGGQPVAWEDGKATIFDDTYTHSVLHEGTEPRYLLIAWFCHPCDAERAIVPPLLPEPLCKV